MLRLLALSALSVVVGTAAAQNGSISKGGSLRRPFRIGAMRRANSA